MLDNVTLPVKYCKRKKKIDDLTRISTNSCNYRMLNAFVEYLSRFQNSCFDQQVFRDYVTIL